MYQIGLNIMSFKLLCRLESEKSLARCIKPPKLM